MIEERREGRCEGEGAPGDVDEFRGVRIRIQEFGRGEERACGRMRGRGCRNAEIWPSTGDVRVSGWAWGWQRGVVR